MATFGLYDELLGQIPQESIDVEEWKRACSLINNFPVSCLRIISCLIVHHYVKSNGLNAEELMDLMNRNKLSNIYGVKLLNNGKGQLYNTVKLPEDLQKIIYVFVTNVVK